MKKSNRKGSIAIGLAVVALWGFAGCEYYNQKPVEANLPTTTQETIPPSDTTIAGDKASDGTGANTGTDQAPPPSGSSGDGVSDTLKQAGLKEEKKNTTASLTEDAGLENMKDVAAGPELEFKKKPSVPFIDPNAKPEDKTEEKSAVTNVKLSNGVWYRLVKVGDDHHTANQYMYPKKDRIALRCPTEGNASENLKEYEAPGQFEEGHYAVVGAEVGYLKYGAYLGSDYDGDQSDTDVEDIKPNSGTVNIRNIELLCGKLDEDGIHVSDRKNTPWVGQSGLGDLARDFSDNNGPMEGLNLDDDVTQYADWGYHEKGHVENTKLGGIHESVGGPVKSDGKNEIVIGVRFKTWDAKDSYARLEQICENESYEPANCGCTDWEEARAFDDPTRGGGTMQYMTVNDCADPTIPWNGTPPNPTVITSMEFITVPFNPKGDPTKKTGPDAIMDYTRITPSGTFFPKEQDGSEAKGEKTKEFLCYDPDAKDPELRNAAMTGMVVRTNWFYGVTYVDQIECKWIAQQTAKK